MSLGGLFVFINKIKEAFMKHKIKLIPLILPLLLVASCGGNNSSSTPPISSVTTTPTVPVEIASIPTIRKGEVGTLYGVEGVVVKHVYTGQGTPYITGFMLANDTGCIYIYGEDVAKSVKVGEKVKVQGTKAYYVPKTDTGAAASTGYKGQLQLTNPVLVENLKGEHAIPESAITSIESLKDVVRHPVNDDISNNLYRIVGRITKAIGGDYTNYYLWDRNRTDSMSFYTQSNGKDYAWLEPYVDTYVDMTFIAINSKPGNAIWRGLPVIVNSSDVTISDKMETDYALERAAEKLLPYYSDATDLSISKNDELLEGMKLSYTSTSPLVTIKEEGDNILISLAKPEEETEVEITVETTYNQTSSSKVIKVRLGVKVDFDTISISEALTKEKGTEVTIEGIVGRKTYKSGTEDPLGAFIIDSTGSIVVYNDAAFMPSLSKVIEGNRVILKGTIDAYIGSNTQDSGYTGDFQLRNTELLFVDGAINEIPETAIEEQTVAWISSQPITNNISSKVFKVNAIVRKSTGYATSYRLEDPTDSSKSLSIYSQRSGSDFAWLDEYADKNVTIYVGVQNLQLKSSGPNWRCCAIKVLTVNS